METIPKVVEAIKDKSWINVVEYPDETLVLEGITECPDQHRTYAIERIRFSKEAVLKLVPLMQLWLKDVCQR